VDVAEVTQTRLGSEPLVRSTSPGAEKLPLN
jgi:hypothetical protein